MEGGNAETLRCTAEAASGGNSHDASRDPGEGSPHSGEELDTPPWAAAFTAGLEGFDRLWFTDGGVWVMKEGDVLDETVQGESWKAKSPGEDSAGCSL